MFIRDVTDRHRQAESDKAYRSAVIEALTRAFEEDVRNSLEAGMNEHLSKPVDSDLLFKSLRWHIANQDESG